MTVEIFWMGTCSLVNCTWLGSFRVFPDGIDQLVFFLLGDDICWMRYDFGIFNLSYRFDFGLSDSSHHFGFRI